MTSSHQGLRYTDDRRILLLVNSDLYVSLLPRHFCLVFNLNTTDLVPYRPGGFRPSPFLLRKGSPRLSLFLELNLKIGSLSSDFLDTLLFNDNKIWWVKIPSGSFTCIDLYF